LVVCRKSSVVGWKQWEGVGNWEGDEKKVGRKEAAEAGADKLGLLCGVTASHLGAIEPAGSESEAQERSL
jgi:hypothetical protein